LVSIIKVVVFTKCTIGKHSNFFANFAGHKYIFMKVVDTKGQECPAPLIATRRELKVTPEGESFEVVTDNKTALDNISRFLKDNKTAFTVSEKDGLWTIKVTAGGPGIVNTDPEVYCEAEVPHFSKGDFVIVFSSDKMGEGEEELGRLLVLNFIKAIKDLDHLPSKMIFYNNGVKLGSEDSPVSVYLDELNRMGVGLLFCATCAKYYSLDDKIKTGTLSNMFEIAQVMASTGNIIKP
jgi:selenium metabolism protein YedF